MNGVLYLPLGETIVDAGNSPEVRVCARLRLDPVMMQVLRNLHGHTEEMQSHRQIAGELNGRSLRRPFWLRGGAEDVGTKVVAEMPVTRSMSSTRSAGTRFHE